MKYDPDTEIVDEFKTESVWMQVEIGRFDPSLHTATKEALAMIAQEWDDRSPGNGVGEITANYSFELDGHRFEVSVAPVKP